MHLRTVVRLLLPGLADVWPSISRRFTVSTSGIDVSRRCAYVRLRVTRRTGCIWRPSTLTVAPPDARGGRVRARANSVMLRVLTTRRERHHDFAIELRIEAVKMTIVPLVAE